MNKSETTDDDVEPIPLSALNGAILTWETADGSKRAVEFGDERTERTQEQSGNDGFGVDDMLGF